MNYFKQIYFEMKHQKMMTWVSISGTALAIFLIMVVVIADSVYSVEAAPESKRSRILYGQGMHLVTSDGDWSQIMLAYDVARKLYEGLDGVEMVSYDGTFWDSETNVNVPGKNAFPMQKLVADANIWKVYDYTFIDGRPFSAAEAESQTRTAVLTRSAARKLFGEEKVSGRAIEVATYPYTVVGVIADPVSVMPQSYADILLPFNPALSQPEGDSGPERWFGNVKVRLLAAENAEAENIKAQVKKRYARLEPEAKKMDLSLKYHQQPYTSREMGLGDFGSNTDPDTESHDVSNAVILALLVLLPAINLSSMTRSRLRHRVSEIGVRRAFGASRKSIIRQITSENFIITLTGGVIGLALSFLFIALFSHAFFQFGGDFGMINSRPSLGMIFNWKIFFFALVMCFVLNLLSATVPAWKAAKVQPAEAISGSR